MEYKNWSNSFKSLVAGSFSGFMEIWFFYPFDYVKTMLQLEPEYRNSKYIGSLSSVRRILRKAGFRGVYFGFQIALIGHVPKSGFRFGGYEYMRAYLADDNGKLTIGGKCLCGISSGFCEVTFAGTPIETIRVKFVNDRVKKQSEFEGFVHGVRTIIRRDGFKGIYQGYMPTLCKQCSNQVIRFAIVDYLKDWYRGANHGIALPNTTVGLFGSIAGGISVLINQPVDVVKSRMQANEFKKYKSSLCCVLFILNQEGIGAFYKGLWTRFTRVSLDEGFTFLLYDWCMEVLS